MNKTDVNTAKRRNVDIHPNKVRWENGTNTTDREHNSKTYLILVGVSSQNNRNYYIICPTDLHPVWL